MPPRTRSSKATASSATAAAAPAKAPAKKRGKVAPPATTTTASDPVATDAAASGDEEKPNKKTTRRRKRVKDDDDEEDDVVKPSRKKAKVDEEDDEDVKDTTDTKDTKDTKDDDKDDEPKKMVKVIKRGKAPVDPESPYVHTDQVYADDEDVYDAMLNQSSIQRNNNKFYVIQLLHPIGNSNAVSLFTRWGRVGELGQQARKGPFAPAVAIVQFKKQFKAKTATNWDDRRSMSGAENMKYMWVERDYEDEKEVQPDAGDSDEPIPDSSLEPEVQALCNMIFSTKLLDAALTEMNYDLNKLPLGRLSKNTILQGFSALKKLADVLDDDTLSGVARNAACSRLTDAYYSVIPHAFGRGRPRIIDTKANLKSELELVDALGDMKIAQTVISDQTPRDADGKPINPLDAHFSNLNLKFMEPIKPSSSEYKQLQEYVTSTHGRTHTAIRNPTIQHVFRVERLGEGEAWSHGGYDKLEEGARLLLWHGSRSTNFGGILSQGLRIAPPEAPVTGYMFGKGVYFADAMSKSANYCHSYASNGVGIMLLCEVAAKPFFEPTNANYNADRDCKKVKALSTKGSGNIRPKGWMDAGEALEHEELKGCWMPSGGFDDSSDGGQYLQYNEYIVYSPSQIRLRYLLMINMA